MKNYTQGPWTFVPREMMEDGSVYPGHIIGGVSRFHVCLMESPLIAEIRYKNPNFSQKYLGAEANAKLIAAAPDLLESLKGVLRVADRATDEFDAARAAIAKATGVDQ